MQQSKRQTIRAIILITTFMGAVVLLSVVALQQIKASTTEQIRDNLQTLLLTVQEAHHILVEQRRFALSSIAENTGVAALTQRMLDDHNNKVPLADSQALKSFRSFISPIIRKFGDQGFFIVAPNKVTIAAMDNASLGTLNLIAQQKPALLAKAFAGETVFIPPISAHISTKTSKASQPQQDTTMFLVAPIVNREQEVIAALALRINPKKYFSSVTTLGRIGDSGETYAFDESGQLLTESRFGDQLRTLNILGTSESGMLNIQFKDPGGVLTQDHQPALPYEQRPLTLMAAQATQGKSGVNTQGYLDYRGVPVMGAWIWDHNFQFGIATEINVEEALAPYYRTRNTFIQVFSITLIMVTLLLKLIFRLQRQHRAKIEQTNAELEQRVKERTADLEKIQKELSAANEELAVLATTDSLTGLYNRRQFDNQLNLEWQRCLRDEKSLAIILFDVDYFKQYNDHYGHLMGDICLKSIGTLLNEADITKRPSDIIARYGGEEFIVMLSNTDHDYCQQAAQRICDQIRSLAIPHEYTKENHPQVVTVSVGFIICDQLLELRPNQLVSRADIALYSAKHAGRNQVVEYHDDQRDASRR
ncbi:diguanylate cyclase [Thalassotalea euphylliae]|uniref:diguanylate cyclase n=1 Tax=Thalassotalea euphylliae TaxID=1655234 RepID=A0A3E0TN45_9GAMM|nr:sensor domain-containing diguanylate cyclase [Thalassotalea euphylliae]REL25542.1 diguanylate cyclase [Thalassotalea euphylliae]